MKHMRLLGDAEAIADCMTEVNTLKKLREVPSVVTLRSTPPPPATTVVTCCDQKTGADTFVLLNIRRQGIAREGDGKAGVLLDSAKEDSPPPPPGSPICPVATSFSKLIFHLFLTYGGMQAKQQVRINENLTKVPGQNAGRRRSAGPGAASRKRTSSWTCARRTWWTLSRPRARRSAAPP